MVEARRGLGNQGEALAAKYLKQRGYRILAQQWQARLWGEIDIIAKEGKVFVFVEVKTRQGGEFGYPEEAVTREKQKKLAQLATYYLARHRLEEHPHRLDVISIELDRGSPKITHWKDILLEE
ncbi:YraN family protein [Candidatus Uhrbacteria bacterium]|nr:YraN family protein [Candidatus Uhrbacteria bacterium]